MPGPVLVVDDDPAILDSIGVALRFRDVPCRTAASGQEALDEAAAATPSLILLDFNMPGINGIETYNRLRASGIRSPVVLMSATSRDVPERPTEMGLSGFLRKPFALTEVFALLDRYVYVDHGQN